MMIRYASYLLLAVLLFATSCGGDDEPTSLTIDEYIAQNNLTTQMTASGLHYIIKEQGTAPNPTLSNMITINYRGYFFDNTTFDQNEGITFPLSNLILGWQEGIQLIGTGGSIMLIIPPSLAYGSRGAGSIPPNTPIAFDIDLLSFN